MSTRRHEAAVVREPAFFASRNDRQAEVLELRVPVPRDSFVVQAPLPELISQRNASIVGFGAREFLDRIRRPDCPVRVIKVGKLRLVNREEFVAWLYALHAERDTSREQPQDEADAVLSEIGLRPIAGRGR